MILSGIFLNLKTINTVFLLDYHENLSQYGQKNFSPSVSHRSTRWFRNSEIHSQLFNALEQEDYPRRWDKAKNGRLTVSTTPISSKLRKEITVITKAKKS